MCRLKRLIHEIHQRALWQALVVYLGASYAVLEAAAYFRDEFGLPDWLPQVALVLLLIGLPVVVVTSLAKEEVYGDEVPARDAEAAAAEDKRLRLLTWRTAGLSFMAAMAIWGVIAAGLVLSGSYERVAANETRTVAVLPFDNLSPDPNDSYFTDGMHEEIISQMGKIASLRVISRTSVMEYKDRAENLRTIANELGVTHILEGSVRRASDRVRITTQLIAADQDVHLWADSYDRELTTDNIFAIQTDIAQRIASALSIQLSIDDKRRISLQPTENLQAYDYYLRGNQYFNRGLGGADILIAVEMYERATALDPAFALAHAALAKAHARTFIQGYDPTAERAARSLSAIERALALNPDLPEARAALGWHYYYVHTDPYRALNEFVGALKSKPNNSDILLAVGLSRRGCGQWDQGRRDLELAFELDPLSHEKLTEVGISYAFARQYEAASDYFGRAIGIAPDHHRAYMHLAGAYIAMDHSADRARSTLREGATVIGRLEFAKRAIGVNHTQEPMWLVAEEFEEEYRSIPSEDFGFLAPKYLVMIAGFHARHGRLRLQRVFADSALAILEGMATSGTDFSGRFITHSQLALAHAYLGHVVEAITAAEAAIRRSPVSKNTRAGPDYIWRYARVLSILGDIEAAIEQLEYLMSIPAEYSRGSLAVDPIWDPLRDHPRFQALVEKSE